MFRSSRYPGQDRPQEPQPPRVAAASLFLLGLILGLTGGLVYAWLISPVVYVNASPARLSERYKDDYIYLTSQSYALTGDWDTAQERLAELEEESLPQRVAALFERYLREGAPAPAVRNLAVLTQQVGGDSPALSLFGPTPRPPQVTPTATPAGSTPTATLLPTPSLTPIPTRTPQPTLTPSPTPVPTATPRPAYRLLSQERVCEPDEPAPRIEVEVVDAVLDPLPGVEVIISWEGGRDRFYTGFRSDQGPGYGDFTMTPGLSYAVTLAEGSPTISGLRVEPCGEDTGGLPGGWRLSFQNLELNRPTPTATPDQ